MAVAAVLALATGVSASGNYTDYAGCLGIVDGALSYDMFSGGDAECLPQTPGCPLAVYDNYLQAFVDSVNYTTNPYPGDPNWCGEDGDGECCPDEGVCDAALGARVWIPNEVALDDSVWFERDEVTTWPGEYDLRFISVNTKVRRGTSGSDPYGDHLTVWPGGVLAAQARFMGPDDNDNSVLLTAWPTVLSEDDAAPYDYVLRGRMLRNGCPPMPGSDDPDNLPLPMSVEGDLIMDSYNELTLGNNVASCRRVWVEASVEARGEDNNVGQGEYTLGAIDLTTPEGSRCVPVRTCCFNETHELFAHGCARPWDFWSNRGARRSRRCPWDIEVCGLTPDEILERSIYGSNEYDDLAKEYLGARLDGSCGDAFHGPDDVAAIERAGRFLRKNCDRLSRPGLTNITFGEPEPLAYAERLAAIGAGESSIPQCENADNAFGRNAARSRFRAGRFLSRWAPQWEAKSVNSTLRRLSAQRKGSRSEN